MPKVCRVCVVGAGVIGSSVAVQLQEMLKEKGEVAILAEKFDIETTSDGAGGIFHPELGIVKSIPENLRYQWFRDSFEYFHGLANSSEASEAGIQFISGYEVRPTLNGKKHFEHPIFKDIFYDIRDLNEKEKQLFGFEGKLEAKFYTTLMIEGRWFLPWLMKKFKQNGGKVIQRKINSFKELAGEFDIAINCAGLGSKELLNDHKVVPIRGQCLRVKAPWVKHFLSFDGSKTYILPGKETVCIGGTYQVGDDDTQVRSENTEEIWKEACRRMPSLEKAEIQWSWVGLRPHREPVRLEREDLRFGDVILTVIHNYGHGGNGITLSWGTGVHVCRLVEEVLLIKSRIENFV